MDKDKKNISFFDKIRYKYRLVIINDDTFEQKTSLKLSKFNIYVWVGTFVLLIVLLVTSIIAYTDLKYYLPGVGKIEVRQKLKELYHTQDSLIEEISTKNLWIGNMQDVLRGDVSELTVENIEDTTQTINPDSIDLNYIPELDLQLRDEVETQDEINKLNNKIVNSVFDDDSFFGEISIKLNLMSPIEGVIVQSFSIKDEHFGIDIAGKEQDKIKAIYRGTVIISEWNPETGNVIAIQHPNNMISFYKHNSVNLKKIGTFVDKGDAIAIIGNTGELSSGPHLHFEIWRNGQVQDPTKYINLEKLN